MNIKEDFSHLDNVFTYLENIGIYSPFDTLLALEAYKFVSRNEILSKVDGIVEDKTDIADEFPDINAKYSVLAERKDEDTIKIYVPISHTVDITNLELDLNLVALEIVYITPLNYEQLKNKEYQYKFNADLLFKRILIEAIRLHATDLHFDVHHVDMKPVYKVSYRRDADLIELKSFELTREMNADIISKLIESKTGISSLDLLDPSGVVGNASNILGNDDVELRISANKVLDGYHYVIRIQQKQTFGFTLNKLGFHENVLRDLEYVLRKRNGITLITGAIRTGKNTTAFAMLNELTKKPIKIVSYESPIEVLMPFTQVDYLDDQNILLNAVRLAKKQDINIAYLNEIPNKEVAFAIRDLANSSVHVVTTMHMNRIWHLPYKLKEYYGDEYKDIISQINGVFNQKMFGVNCPECLEQVMVKDLDSVYRDKLWEMGVESIKTSPGCPYCDGEGVVPGKNQPYAEHLIFTEQLIDRLLACDHPYEMERIIRDEVREKSQSFEDYMKPAFEVGSVPLYAIDHL